MYKFQDDYVKAEVKGFDILQQVSIITANELWRKAVMVGFMTFLFEFMNKKWLNHEQYLEN